MPLPAFAGYNSITPHSEPLTASSSAKSSTHTPGTSIMSATDVEKALHSIELAQPSQVNNSISEFEVVKVAEGFWNLARCNPAPTSGSCPRTAIVHLECLEQKSKQEGIWTQLEEEMEQDEWDTSNLAYVVPLTPRTRDKMLAITQSFLHKALEVHRGGVNCYNRGGYLTPPGDCNFIVLPPAKVLEYFLRSYVRSLSVYYPLVTAGCVDPNEMLQNNQASTLLVLLMIAQGAAAMPRAEAQCLSTGLTETCRISLFDIVEKDVELSADPTTLRCALLFIVLGVWSGDKWLMDIAVGQRGMYMSMLKNAGMLEPQASTVPVFDDSTNTELRWRTWVHCETRNRLVYNYVMLDQELSLFYDTAPLFAITDLRCPLPGPEELWKLPSSNHWVAEMQTMYGNNSVNPQLLGSPSNNPSLHGLFQKFLRGDLNFLSGHCNLFPQQLRLLLHPLQSMLFHLRQMLSCLGDFDHLTIQHASPGPAAKSSTLDRLEEVRELLKKWYTLTLAYTDSHPNCPVTHCNLVLYHLIHLNTLTNFPEIERLARREGIQGRGIPWDLALRQQVCFFRREEAVVHCGQVLRLLRTMPKDCRPAWWPAAMYRATLILWTESLSRVNNTTSFQPGQIGLASPAVVIDQVSLADAAVHAYVEHGDGTPILTHPDGGAGSTFSLDDPADVLAYAVASIDAGHSSRIGDGIKRKLGELGKNWDMEVAGSSAGRGMLHLESTIHVL
ncbi:hypothetical protein VTI74DRAFT_3361 [Chaetomium olivicolor]